VSRKTRKDDSVDVGEEVLPWYRRPGRGAVLSLLTTAGLLIVAVSGLEHLKARVGTLPEYNPTPRLRLMEPPQWVESEGWRTQILASVHLPEKPNMLDGKLIRDIASQLTHSGWASQVRHIRQEVDGTIRIWCDYRKPIAMVQTDRTEGDETVYVAIDKDGVRLPHLYKNVSEAGWMEIVGVESPIPRPGQAFEGEDARAAVKLAEIIDQKDLARRIRAIDISNFRKRKNPRQDQIFLLARGSREPIIWGSAIGEEIEESAWQDKIKLITLLLKNGSPHVQADVSCYADRVIMKTSPAFETADSSQARDR
jgi:hypothetical protein